MNIQRFTAPTSREALAKARAVFGEGTLILSNRPTTNGVEVMATGEETLAELDAQAAAQEQARQEEEAARQEARRQPRKEAKPAPVSTAAAVAKDTEQLAMSTLSFQDYVRERMLRRRHEAMQTVQAASQAVQAQLLAPKQAQPAIPAAFQFAPPMDARAEPRVEPRAEPRFEPRGELQMDPALDMFPRIDPSLLLQAVPPEPVQPAPVQVAPAAPAQVAPVQAVAPVAAPVVAPVAVAVAAPAVVEQPVVQVAPVAQPAPVAQAMVAPVAAAVAATVETAAESEAKSQGIVDELQAMKAMIDERFNTLAWLGETRQDPIRANLMLKLIRAGFSPTLARTVLEHLPEGTAPAAAVRWLTGTLQRNLRTDEPGHRMLDEGGVFALVGATGVGKTTTVAKLAGLCAREHGNASVGLITLDTWRIAAHEQLRAHARQFGIVAHQAHDRAALQELLNLFSNRHMVLIDTSGVAPTDPRMRGMLDTLDLPGVNRVVVLNAGSHGDTLDHVLSSFKGSGTQNAILSKIDEAVKLGPALDTLIRHQFVLRGVTNGQRVPEDWNAADSATLISQSMRAPARSAFDPRAADLNFFFSPDDAANAPQRAEAARA
ncbi:flagellar biosynthesis protein FlhF [Variovorax sp. VNK109]|jgi:flagellar biosynthesis protein FlhF|uniref:flagellar biosynthesis protein FlhF n=1 Tax=Variovorax sp. VNK109 TaxID=3400919 RepID=UPI003BFDE61B